MIYQIVNSLEEMNSKLNRVIELLECNGSQSGGNNTIFTDTLDVITLLSLPDHLRRTATTLFEIGPATADEIAKKNLQGKSCRKQLSESACQNGSCQKIQGRKESIFLCQQQYQE